jgi:DNA-3-methyladenine glycosylase I
MIRHRAKIAACISNARTVRELVAEHGSMAHFIDSFGDHRTVENLLRLKKALETRFDYIGGVTVYHFLTEIGLRVVKPDRVLRRIFHRLGLLDSEVDSEDQIVETIEQGRAFAEATGLPIRYIDIVFVAYGQVQALEFGIDRGICLEEPRCRECGIVEHCGWYRNRRSN